MKDTFHDAQKGKKQTDKEDNLNIRTNTDKQKDKQINVEVEKKPDRQADD